FLRGWCAIRRLLVLRRTWFDGGSLSPIAKGFGPFVIGIDHGGVDVSARLCSLERRLDILEALAYQLLIVFDVDRPAGLDVFVELLLRRIQLCAEPRGTLRETRASGAQRRRNQQGMQAQP